MTTLGASSFHDGIYPRSIVTELDLEALASCVFVNLFSGGTARSVVCLFLGGSIGMGHETTSDASSKMGIASGTSTAEPLTMLELDT